MIRVSTATYFRTEQNIIYFHRFTISIFFPVNIASQFTYRDGRTFRNIQTDKIENGLTYWWLNFRVVEKKFPNHIFHPTLCLSFHPANLLPLSWFVIHVISWYLCIGKICFVESIKHYKSLHIFCQINILHIAGCIHLDVLCKIIVRQMLKYSIKMPGKEFILGKVQI